ncbi:AAC(3) family N-acetyltransferase [uncultured Campylobacter sp.]|uniref:AAC(3) family N-acetyltransferase n=1 Tax=uncultured Campylobacter sp. TaxID=218934 RepID=UPI002623D412|nr:AAC(3) family N-acetyltransferase [uncultured Campylobacter sp.]
MNPQPPLALLEFNSKIYSYDDLIRCLRDIGIKDGDTLCVHTELITLGRPLVGKDEFLGSIVQAFYEVIGRAGTLIMPTFTYSFCKNQIYDKRHSRSTMGLLTEYYRHCDGVVRTDDPIFSFAISGANASEYLGRTPTCFSKGCVYDKLRQNGGKIVLFGLEHLGYTFTHYLEEQIGVSYRYFKRFSGMMIDENGVQTQQEIDYYVRYLDRTSEMSVPKQIEILKRSNNFNLAPFGGAMIVAIDAQKYYDETYKAIMESESNIL